MKNKLLLFLLCILCFVGCLNPRVPMRKIVYKHTNNTKNSDLFIFFPGRGGNYKDFKKEGLIDILQNNIQSSDAMSIDAIWPYYRNRTLIKRYKEDILKPAIKAGYNKIHLVGVSMGGLGITIIAENVPEKIQTLIYISPFLGYYDDILKEILKVGGLDTWKPGEFDPNKDWQRMIWSSLKQKIEQGEPEIYLGYGRNDNIVKAHKLLTPALPPKNVVSTDGKHDIPTFVKIWEKLTLRIKKQRSQ